MARETSNIECGKIAEELESLGLELIRAAKLGWSPVGRRVQTGKIKKVSRALTHLHLRINIESYGRAR